MIRRITIHLIRTCEYHLLIIEDQSYDQTLVDDTIMVVLDINSDHTHLKLNVASELFDMTSPS